jgi:hypothetical protein
MECCEYGTWFYFNEQALGEKPSRNKYYFDAENEK